MDVIGTAINAAVVAMVGLILAWLGKGRFEAHDRRLDRFEERVDRFEERMEHRMDTLQASIDSMRSDLTQVALAVGVQRRATNA